MQPLTSLQQEYGASHCPDNPSQIIQECGDSVSCLNDYTLFNARVLGMEAQDTYNTFFNERIDATRHCEFANDCLIFPKCLFLPFVISSSSLFYLSIVLSFFYNHENSHKSRVPRVLSKRTRTIWRARQVDEDRTIMWAAAAKESGTAQLYFSGLGLLRVVAINVSIHWPKWKR